ncbi:MAG: nucleotidyl transferase AbiEii/AbiGii toxin family protein [Eubacterium sp.]|nr:nucleotidyl transferase AbiEii/AbiGii toxin family protein [Eubacterium sp.]
MNAESVKARLKNFAVKTGHTFQEALIYYGLERTIYRISVSKYAEHFVLKGGLFLYAIFEKNYGRATTDIDLLATRISNSDMEMKEIFRDIFALETDDALRFEAIIHNGYLNSRYKDFYDLCILTEKYSFSYDKVKEAVVETFQNRGTALSMDTAAFGSEFLQDPLHRNRWNAFLKKKKAIEAIPFKEAVLKVKNFAEPLLNSGSQKKTRWSAEQGIWL